MSEPWARAPLVRHDVLDSTMDEGRRLLAGGTAVVSHSAIVAAAQTAGRGRHGRRWSSDAHAGLYVTVLRKLLDGPRGEGLSLVAGLAAHTAVCAQLAPQAAARVQMKWPNDLIVGKHKLGGVLVTLETAADGAPWALIGAGINVAPRRALPASSDDIHERRYIGVLDLASDAARGQGEVIEALLGAFRAELGRLMSVWARAGVEPLLPAMRQVQSLLGCTVRAMVAGRPIEGTAVGMGPNGELVIRTCEGEQAISSGEVEKVRATR